ncbi:efflux RND transporter periplasmic adaptor subunit [Chryseotalea sanaruensis]|uniref:Efflux RND transporter periplasmic adaptor subunit n=1 Tax=Chryseotalea sanaruensis TaxID=2482724 RepID=A0A401U7K5_9BACT|nr:efflux RND transporter periplasmic adaptor subunit [Chryseotalea sanaruensis]GCC50870.1 efflux RND transporter periplasmic adaptor subunit [Chryseotalea sanaruensis]
MKIILSDLLYTLVTRYGYIFCLGLTMACGSKAEVTEQDPASLRGQVPPTEVEVTKAIKKPFEYLIRTSGKIEAEKELDIVLKVDGTINQLNIKNGDQLKAGQLLATLDNQRYKLDLDKAEIQLREKKISYEDQLIGFKSQDEAKLKIIQENIRFSSGLAAAENAYEQAHYIYNNSLIKAPISGIVSNLNFKEGSSVKNGDVLCNIYQPNNLVVSCDILESEAFMLAKTQPASVQSLFEKDKIYDAKVKLINPRVDNKSGMLNVKISITSSAKLYPGMNVSVTIKVPSQNNIVLPKEAVIVRSGKQVVFTEEGGLAKWNYVTTGRENGKEIEILGGLKENSNVITTNNLQLAHDAPVSAGGGL